MDKKGGWHQATLFSRGPYQKKTMTKAAKRVFELIEEKHLSEYQFCQATDFSNSTLNGWKNHNIDPSQEKIVEICKLCNKTLDEFYSQGVYAKDITKDKSITSNREYRMMNEMCRKIVREHKTQEVLPYMEFVLHSKT